MQLTDVEAKREAEGLARPHSADCFLNEPLDVYWHGGVPILRADPDFLRKGCTCGRDEEVERIAARLCGPPAPEDR